MHQPLDSDLADDERGAMVVHFSAMTPSAESELAAWDAELRRNSYTPSSANLQLRTQGSRAMRPAVLALALLLAACADDEADVEAPEETTTSVDLSEPEPLPTVPTTMATTAPPTTAAPATAPPTTRAPAITRATQPATTSPPQTQASVYYANCSEARAAGAAPVHRGEPGYGSHLDRDNDGVGCE